MKQKGMNVKKRLVKKGKLSREEERREGGNKQSALDTSMKLSKINSIKKKHEKVDDQWCKLYKNISCENG